MINRSCFALFAALSLTRCTLANLTSPEDGGAGEDSGLSDGSNLHQDGGNDAGIDGGGTISDAGNSTSDAGAASGCKPANTSALAPVTVHQSMPFGANVCSAVEINLIYAACFFGGDCAGWKSAHASCAACVFTSDTSAAWGPFVTHTSRAPLDANELGCIDNFGTGCGAVYGNYASCQNMACENNTACAHAVTADLRQCHTAAASGGCKSQAVAFASSNCLDVVNNRAANVCFPASGRDADTKAFVVAMATAFCGPP